VQAQLEEVMSNQSWARVLRCNRSDQIRPGVGHGHNTTTLLRSLSALSRVVMPQIRPLMPLALPRSWSSLEMQVFIPLTPPPLYPLQHNADIHWNADTGATAHMTPHRHWICNYTPKCALVKLADNKVIYSARVGSVVFQPAIGGRCQVRVYSGRGPVKFGWK